MKNKINVRYIFIFAGISFCIFLARNLGYLIREFAIPSHNNVNICDTCSMRHMNKIRNTRTIPEYIHQIYFSINGRKMSEELSTARNTWLTKHRNYTHYLWNEMTVLDFIREKYPHLESRYKSYNYWVRRVNVARYLILYHYGGWYIDTDMTCIHSLSELAMEATRLNKSVIQHYTFPVGTSNDFFGITPKHQFLKSVLDHLPNSDRWFIFPYPNTVLTTGTTYMWGRYLNYPYKDEFMILGQEEVKKYVRHHHHSTWHGWDALVIRFFVHYQQPIMILVISLLVVGLLYFIKSRRKVVTETG